MARKPKPTKRPRQRLLGSDWGPEVHKDIDQAAHLYDDAVRDRLPYTKAEDQAKKNLIAVMQQHGKQLYKTPDGLIVTMTATANVSVKKYNPDQPEGKRKKTK